VTEGRNPPASLIRNTIAQSAGSFSGYLFSFLSAPVILAGLGLRNFGIWALTGALAQYTGLLDLGVGASLSRYIAVHDDDRQLCGEYLAIGWITIVVIAAVLVVGAFFGAAPLSHALHGVSAADMRIIVYSSAVLLCCSMVSNLIASYPIGRRRMVAPNLAFALGATINFIASVGSIALGAKLPAYALANAGAGTISVFVMAVLVRRAEGPLPLSRPESSRARSFLGFSSKTQLVRIAGLVNYQTDKVVIAFAVGPAAAGAYELANRVAIAIRQVGIYVTSAVNIELASMFTHLGLDQVRMRYPRLNQVTAALSFPPVLLTMATAPLLLKAWLGHVPPNAVAVLVALDAAYLVGVSTGVGYAVAVAVGNPGIVARIATATMLANIALTVALGPLFGLWGVLAGTVIALSAGSLAQVITIHKRYSLPAATYVGAVGGALRVYVGLAAPIAVISFAHLARSRGVAVLLFVLLAVAYVGGCAMWALKTGRLPQAVGSRVLRMGWLRPSA
jgi:O-antigen/teichoic acid export membrane protein